MGTSAPLESLMTPCNDVFAIWEKPIAAEPINKDITAVAKHLLVTTASKGTKVKGPERLVVLMSSYFWLCQGLSLIHIFTPRRMLSFIFQAGVGI